LNKYYGTFIPTGASHVIHPVPEHKLLLGKETELNLNKATNRRYTSLTADSIIPLVPVV